MIVLLEKYYEEYLNEGAPFLLAVNEASEIVGFCMGYRKATTHAREKFERNNKFRLSARLFGLCCTFNKNAWIRVISKVKSVFRHKNPAQKVSISPTEGSLLSICAHEKYRGTDVAKTLVVKFEDELKSIGIEEYTLSVYATNMRARAFYEKMGFRFHSESGDSVKYIKTIQG